MIYIEKRTKAGRTIEVERCVCMRRYQKGERRQRRKQETSEAQKKVNTRQAEKKLRRLINENFGYRDWHIDMGYVRSDLEEPRSKEQMRADMQKFLKKLRRLYKRAGQQLRYIHVMEVGERGARHHHMMLNHADGIDTAQIQQAWDETYAGKSMIHFSPLDKSGNYTKLANYLIKYTDKTVGTEDGLMKKRWSCSRNLRKPVTISRIISKYDVLREPNRVRGYYIDKNSIERGTYGQEYGGFDFLNYTLVRIE